MNKLAHFLNVLRNLLEVKLKYRPKFNKEQLIPKWYCPIDPSKNSSEPIITWIGQATFLIQIDGINILTDPMFFDLPFVYKRLVPPGIPLNKLPIINVVAISHNHIDHMDKRSLLAIKHHNPLILAPHGDGKWFHKSGFKNVYENKWGNSHTLLGLSNEPIKFTYLPAKHWSGRNIFDFNRSHYGSWMIESKNHSIYFAGDSSYGGHYKEIGQEFSSIKTALLPIGPVEPRRNVEHAHLDGKEAVKAFIELNAQNFVPMHWGTFQFGAEEFEVPIQILEEAWQNNKEQTESKELLILKFGEKKLI